MSDTKNILLPSQPFIQKDNLYIKDKILYHEKDSPVTIVSL